MSKTRNALLTLLVLAVLTGPLRLLLAAMLPSSAVNPVPGCIAGAALSLMTLGLPAWLLRPWTSPRLLQQKSILPDVAMGVLAAMLVRFGFRMVDEAWQTLLGIVPEALPVTDSLLLAMLYIAGWVIIPALTEEAFFRGALLTGLLDGSRRVTAVLLTATAFALMHGRLANLPSLLMLSLFLTLLMLYSGHIAVPMAAHLVYNLAALGTPVIPEWLSGICCGAAVTLCGYLPFCLPTIAHPPMKLTNGLLAAAAFAVLILSYMI